MKELYNSEETGIIFQRQTNNSDKKLSPETHKLFDSVKWFGKLSSSKYLEF